MKGAIEIVCCRPERGDALFEAARLALSFLEVSTRPGRSSMLSNPGERLRVYLGSAAQFEGSSTGKNSLLLLQALQKYGVPIYRTADDGTGERPSRPSEWTVWWGRLASGEPGAQPDALQLEIV